MGFKYNPKIQRWEAFVSQRHPVSGKPVTIRRRCQTREEAIKTEQELFELLSYKFGFTFPTWKEVVEAFVKTKHDQGEWTLKTKSNYEYNLASHTYPIWGARPANEITTQEIRDLIRTGLESYSQSHRKSLLKFIRGTFAFAVENELLDRNPTPQLHFRLGDKIKPYLTVDQVKRLLDKAKELDSPWYHHWAMALYTGMRNGELFALKWENVNLNDNFILVNSSWNNKDGFKSTKSGDDRMVEIAPNLVHILKELKLQNNEPVFVLPRVHHWDRGVQAKELRKFLFGLGMAPIRFHDLRATWATIMLGRGIEPIKVMKMGGWKDLKTMEIYVRKAGIDIKGITTGLDLHNPSRDHAKIIELTRV